MLCFTYVDEAVMEVEAENGRAHPLLLVHSLRHGRPHDPLEIAARFVVERRRQLPVGDADRGQHGDEAEGEDSVVTHSGHNQGAQLTLLQMTSAPGHGVRLYIVPFLASHCMPLKLQTLLRSISADIDRARHGVSIQVGSAVPGDFLLRNRRTARRHMQHRHSIGCLWHPVVPPFRQ